MSRRVLYLDAVGGAAGDMLLASLLDLGVSLDPVRRALDALRLPGVELEVFEVERHGLRARQLDVRVNGVLADSTTPEGTPGIRMPRADALHAHGHRPWLHIRGLLEGADLPERAKGIALDAFRRLAEAESAAHGVPLEQVEFHEVGSNDAIADIVGTAVAIGELDVGCVLTSPLPLGRALIRGAHGPLPIPGPATLHLLKGAELVETSLDSETVTPTGAALIMTLSDGFGPIPSMSLEGIGIGAGHKHWPDRPNVLRALLGRTQSELPPRGAGDLHMETNLDDMSPEHLDPLFEALFEAGAIDVWATPAIFKKGRMGAVVGILAPAEKEPVVTRALFRHSPTLGVRMCPVDRRRLPRVMERVETPYGPIRVKRSPRPDAPDHLKPEHDDVRAAARRAAVPLRTVEDAALYAARRRSSSDG